MPAPQASVVVCDGDSCRIVERASDGAPPASPHPPVLSPALTSLLGDSLQSKDGQVPLSTITGKGKVIALYFSAHWCGPCRGFTPILAEMYSSFKASHARAADWEVVFVSSDQDEASFGEYYEEMPWMALPYEQRDRKAKLSTKFKVRGIPSLVLIDGEDGSLITASGREAIESDPKGEQFPWKPKTPSELLSGKLVDKEGKEHDGVAALAGKYKLIYFSAHWCPPCKAFTPKLSHVYNKLKAAGHPVECVFVSSDKSESQFQDYLAEMASWLAVPFNEQQTKAGLNSLFEVDGIPSLVVLDPEDKVVSLDARPAVGADPEGDNFPWRPKPLDLLGPHTASSLNEGPVLLLALDDSSPEAIAARSEELLGEVARASLVSGSEIRFLYAPRTDDLVGQVMEFCKMEAMGPGKEAVLLLDIPLQCIYKMGAEIAAGGEGGLYPSGVLTAAAIKQFVSKFLDDSLPKSPLE